VKGFDANIAKKVCTGDSLTITDSMVTNREAVKTVSNSTLIKGLLLS
jgi:hypothetical protein